MERERFLSRVAAALLTADLPPAPDVGPLPEPDESDLVGLFRSRAQAVSAVVHGPVSRSGVLRTVTGIASGHSARSFVSWDDIGQVPSALVDAGLARVRSDWSDSSVGERLEAYRQVDLGVTGSSAALAESGSVVLVHGPGRPRMASLVPDVHVALVEVAQLHRSLAHWAAREPTAVADTANLVVVTGPSRSADIELELNLGVHGPRNLHVVLID